MDLQVIQNKIFEVRGCRVMLDFHLAELYQVETRALKQAVKRNIGRFPSDFMFVLSKEEANTDAQFNDIYQALTQLLSQSQEQKQRRRIGFVTYDEPGTDR